MANALTRGSSRGGNLWDWDPFRGLFSSGFQSLGIDMRKTDEGYTVEIPVPGFRPDDVEVTYEDGVVTVTGRAGQRSVSRAFTVPDDVEADGIEANIEHGLLTLSLRRGPEAQPRRIPIRAGTLESSGTKEPSSTQTNAQA